MTSYFDRSLSERFQAGSERALAEVYRLHSRPMSALAYRLLGDHELAAEAVQLAFVRAWRAAHRFDPVRELRPWLYSITRKAAIDVWRRERPHLSAAPLMDDDIPAEEPAPDAVPCVRIALDRLPFEERDVLRLAYFDDLTQREIAERLNIPVGTVGTRTSRAKRRLATLLSAGPGFVPHPVPQGSGVGVRGEAGQGWRCKIRNIPGRQLAGEELNAAPSQLKGAAR
ncbi:RNA polymerase sigma factor [Nonomuraea sp. NPDC049141]|uniref:RNA polymerase sigma factor n=1 Tax=Nonomuraea sp. NPDC049141 TaxID=3155500 RepID=UPI0034007E72